MNLTKCPIQRTVKLGYSRRINVEMDRLNMIPRFHLNNKLNENGEIEQLKIV